MAAARRTTGHQGTPVSYPQPARAPLRALAAHLQVSPCDTATGPYDLVHYRQWNNPARHGAAVREVVRWRGNDRSGGQLASQHPASVVPITHDWWRPGDLYHVRLIDPFTRTEVLRQNLGINELPRVDPTEVLANLADLSTWYSPRRDGRAAALTVLADLSPLTYYPRLFDRSGRPGIAVAATSGGRRALLVLHPSTGEVLAYESAHLGLFGWRVETYLLYLSHSHATRRWWEPQALPRPAPPPRPLYSRPQQHWLLTTPLPCDTTTTQGANP
ncbi:hypothetical protein [Micromonospora peucetia]|uniref:Uncharacterized protein n=1 Tax=Micromonospora peucetia TaxID=47871 RepID=A0ABZ1EJ62_9ACTN|nr:hypothetical protein [Micromonospora peucetia]WSA34277.1 hypothetical protein OIE14_09660 [Micromonospora peucetia]